MSLRRLQQRVPGVRLLGPARLPAHRLRFHKIGSDGSGKCDAFYTGQMADAIHGVLYHIDRSEKKVLDRIEGLGFGYDEKIVELEHGDQPLEAITYVATRIADDLKPFEWYLNHVLIGAREASLPQPYVADIERVVAIPDPNRKRHAREIAIHD